MRCCVRVTAGSGWRTAMRATWCGTSAPRRWVQLPRPRCRVALRCAAHAPQCLPILQSYQTDAAPVVSQSCIVALDMLAVRCVESSSRADAAQHEQSGEFQYANGIAAVTEAT